MKDKFNSAFQGFCVAACVLLVLAACKHPDNTEAPATPKWAVTVQYDGDCGTASANPNPAAQGEKVTITAEPKSSHKFKTWKVVSGSVVLYSINTNPATFTMPGNAVTIMAEFDILTDITLDDVIYGYEQPVKKSVPVADLGIDSKTVKNVELGAGNESPFVLDEQDLKNKLAVGNVMNFLVLPKAGLKAGTYTDTVTVTHGSGKTAVFTMGITVTPKPVVISGLTANNREYDGTTAVTLAGTAIMSGIIDGDDVELVTIEGAFEDKDAGTGKAVILSGSTLSGADAGNYTPPQQSGIKADILPRPVSITIDKQPTRTLVPFGAADALYNGGLCRQNDTADLTVYNLIADETVSVSVKKNNYGLSGSIDTGGECTLTIVYDGTEVDQTNPVSVALDVGGNYTLPSYNAAVIKVSIRDGLDPDRWLPVTNTNIEDFQVYVNTADGLNRHYKLMENITLDTTPPGGSNWTAIGADAGQFTGSFDGGGKVINNLVGRQGMFAYIGKDGVVKNTALVSGSITGANDIGGLAGVNDGTIQNSYTTQVSVSGSFCVGGLAGVNNGTIQNCYTTGNVSGETNRIGGVVGRNNGTVQNCYAMGKISGQAEVGGIAGFVDEEKEVRNCAALNLMVATTGISDTVNRVIGSCSNPSGISNNYARADMYVKYNWNGSAGKKKIITSNRASFDGQTIGSSRYRDASWWTTAGNWSENAWDFTNTWQMNANNLPKLRNVGGNQVHLFQMNPVEMVQVPAGIFLMGTPSSEDDRYGSSGERPQRTISLSGFYIGICQVTQEQYSAVMGINPSYNSSAPATGESQENRPVEQISWYDAILFCNKLSIAEGLSPAYSISGKGTNPETWGTVPVNQNSAWDAVQIVSGSNGYRLPTEAQWEYACRAGTETSFNNGESSSLVYNLSDIAWYSGSSEGKTHEVGRLQRNKWDLYDMHGNVNEWCWDWYVDYDYTDVTLQDPPGPSNGYSRITRGGSFNGSMVELRSSARSNTSPDYKYSEIGLRLVRPAP